MRFVVLAASALLAGLAIEPTSASAVTIDYTALTPGQFTVDLGTPTASANVRSFEQTTVSSVMAVGISGGAVSGGIDGAETLTFTLAFMDKASNMGDFGNEVSLLDVNGTVVMTLVLSASGAFGDVTGPVTTFSPVTNSGGREF